MPQWNGVYSPSPGYWGDRDGESEDSDDFPTPLRCGISPLPPYPGDPRYVAQMPAAVIPPEFNFDGGNNWNTGSPPGPWYGPGSPFIPPVGLAPPGPIPPYTGDPRYVMQVPPATIPPQFNFNWSDNAQTPWDDGDSQFRAPVMGPIRASPFPFGQMALPPPGTPGANMKPVLFAWKDPYDDEYVTSRPSDWRYDYTPPRRFKLLSRLRRPGTDQPHLNPVLLMPNSRMPVMAFDLRSDHPFDHTNLELLTIAGRRFNLTDLTQLATTRPVRHMRFYHPRLPWYIDVRATQPNGILVGDVLHQIHAKLHRSIRPQDFTNTVLDATDRELITDAYRNRCDDRVDIMQQGVRRVDFMGSDVILQGFIEGRDGMFLMKTTRHGRNVDV
ncbi:hypothetical protein DFH06DRAFT_1334506 [Mycena polygramma]|nr:hypothetical protein DFH06DRAFT_1334506 [Mycena polygramma]